jgi:hypothetical protein
MEMSERLLVVFLEFHEKAVVTEESGIVVTICMDTIVRTFDISHLLKFAFL